MQHEREKKLHRCCLETVTQTININIKLCPAMEVSLLTDPSARSSLMTLLTECLFPPSSSLRVVSIDILL
eukprot:g16159.t1